MRKISSVSLLISLGFVLSFVVFSCTWDKYEIDTSIVIENVSFSTDIVPIFNQSCNSVGCHNAGGSPPNLMPNDAYKDLFDAKMIDLENPTKSELYVRMIDVAKPMPVTGLLSETTVKKVLVWIEEGAKDN